MNNVNNNLMALFLVALFWLVVLVFLVVLATINVYSLTYSINSSLNITSESVQLNIFNVRYNLSNNISFSLQQTNVTIDIINITEIRYQNQTNVTLICDVPETVNLKNNSIDIISSNLGSKLETKTTEMSDKIIDNINFQLKPTQDKFDALEIVLQQCRDNMTIAEKQRYLAELQQEKWYLENERCKKDNTIWVWTTIGVISLFLFFVVYITGGFNIFSKKMKFSF